MYFEYCETINISEKVIADMFSLSSIKNSETSMILRTVGISDMIVSNDSEEKLVTYSLGSCLGLTVYDSIACVGGMIHCMLPLSSTDPEKAKRNPEMFVDTGVPLLFNKFFAMGGDYSRMIVKAAGCSQLLDPRGFFKIGSRNFTVLRKILWKNSILLKAQDIGGSESRTLTLEISTGRTIVKSRGVERNL